MIATLDQTLHDKNIRRLKELIDSDLSIIDVNEEEYQDDVLSKTIRQTQSLEIVKLLLEYGADPAFVNSDGRAALSEAIAINRKDIAALLLEFSANANMSTPHPYTLFFIQDQALVHADIDMIELLLDYGADVFVQLNLDELIDDAKDLSEYIWLNENDLNNMEYLRKNRHQIEKLLYAKLQPFLKLNGHRYIIYENKETDEDVFIHLFTDKQKHPDKKYLYADNKIDAFVYWCYTKSLLNDPAMEAIGKYVSLVGADRYTHLSNLVKDLTGGKLTVDYFNEAGKDFATHYLTVTHWWYNLHTDFNRLYQEEGIKLPRAIQSQEEFDTLMKLLDIRYEQYQSGKHFNANQNKAELEALIEDKEPPKREVDLSALLGENTNEILPEDFMS